MTKANSNVQKAGVLVAGALTMWLAIQGPGILPALAVWLPAIFFLHFARHSSVLLGYLAVSAVYTVVLYFALRGIMPLPAVEYLVTTVISGLIAALPILLDRVLYRRLGQLSATLIYPAASVTLEFLGSMGNPFGTWGNPGYSLSSISPLIQLTALTGIWGVAFLIHWLAPVVLAVWENRVWRPAMAMALVMLCALSFGTLRLVLDAPSGEEAQIAMVRPSGQVVWPFMVCGAGDTECHARLLAERESEMLAQTRSAIAAGADLVLWSEGAVGVLAVEEADFMTRVGQIARDAGVYLVLGVAVMPEERGQPWQNKLVAIDNNGNPVWSYHKSKVVPGEPIEAGSGIVPILETPFGRFAALICFDADFPALVRQAGLQEADVLLVSANDWLEIADLHADMAMVRGIENGVSMVRATSSGHSMVTDRVGRTIALLEADRAEESVLIAMVDTRGVGTGYVRMGDLFGWLSVLLFLALILLAVMRGRRQSGRE